MGEEKSKNQDNDVKVSNYDEKFRNFFIEELTIRFIVYAIAVSFPLTFLLSGVFYLITGETSEWFPVILYLIILSIILRIFIDKVKKYSRYSQKIEIIAMGPSEKPNKSDIDDRDVKDTETPSDATQKQPKKTDPYQLRM